VHGAVTVTEPIWASLETLNDIIGDAFRKLSSTGDRTLDDGRVRFELMLDHKLTYEGADQRAKRQEVQERRAVRLSECSASSLW
jgi:hypothetical protein